MVGVSMHLSMSGSKAGRKIELGWNNKLERCRRWKTIPTTGLAMLKTRGTEVISRPINAIKTDTRLRKSASDRPYMVMGGTRTSRTLPALDSQLSSTLTALTVIDVIREIKGRGLIGGRAFWTVYRKRRMSYIFVGRIEGGVTVEGMTEIRKIETDHIVAVTAMKTSTVEMIEIIEGGRVEGRSIEEAIRDSLSQISVSTS